jgi:hypothetical protein
VGETTGAVTGAANGTATITVTTEDGNKSATCAVTVKTLVSIALSTESTKKSYYIGEEIDLTGLVVTATFSDNSTEPIVITAEHLSKSVFAEADAGNDPVPITGRSYYLKVITQSSSKSRGHVLKNPREMRSDFKLRAFKREVPIAGEEPSA